MATASFVSNFQKYSNIEFATPPPPMPATVHKAIIKPNVTKPAISR